MMIKSGCDKVQLISCICWCVCMCTHVCMHVCVCACIYIYMYVCVWCVCVCEGDVVQSTGMCSENRICELFVCRVQVGMKMQLSAVSVRIQNQ